MVEIAFSLLVSVFTIWAGVHLARSVRNRRGKKYLVYFNDGGTGVYGPNLHARLIKAGVVARSVAL